MTPTKPVDRVLLALQFWNGDKRQAADVAKFIADLEPQHSNHADFLLVSRFDTAMDPDLVKYVGRKFNTYATVSKSREVGWPSGCNGLWFATMNWVYHMIDSRRIPAYKAILTFEADCAPLTSNWIAQLSRSWDSLQVKKPTYVAGAMLKYPGLHVNGNAMFSGDPKFLHWIAKKVGGCPANAGWDYVLAKDFQTWGWAELPGLKSYWGTKTMAPEGYSAEVAAGTVFLHGVKDDSLLRASRAALLGR